MSDEPITVKKPTGYVMMSREELDEANASHDALTAFFDEISKPGYVPPKPWEGEPLTPVPEAYYVLLEALPEDGYIAERALFEVLELHGPKPYMVFPDGTVRSWRCEGCDASGYDWEYPDWPCRTTEAIAGHLGVEL